VGEPLIAQQFIGLNNIFHLGLSDMTIHAIALPLSFFLITTFHIIIGEQVPKTFAIRDPLAMAKIIIQPLYYFFIIFKPLIRFLDTLSQLSLSVLGVKKSHEEDGHSEEELRMIVAESEEDGHINASERELIQNVFDFDNSQVSEIMTPSYKIFGIDRNRWTPDDIHALIQE
jgi:CBS domain containing-hemolysin-like protein